MGLFPIVHCRKHDSDNFVSVSQKRKHRENNSGKSESEEERDAAPITCTFVPQAVSSLSPHGESKFKTCCDNDLGKWVGRSSSMTISQKMEILKRCWSPPESYNFADDATHLKRKFKYS